MNIDNCSEQEFVRILTDLMNDRNYLRRSVDHFYLMVFSNCIYVSITDADEIKHAFDCWYSTADSVYKKAYSVLFDLAADKRVFGALIAKSGGGLIVVPVFKGSDEFKILFDDVCLKTISISEQLQRYQNFKEVQELRE